VAEQTGIHPLGQSEGCNCAIATKSEQCLDGRHQSRSSSILNEALLLPAFSRFVPQGRARVAGWIVAIGVIHGL
jgi:hypothetical protein